MYSRWNVGLGIGVLVSGCGTAATGVVGSSDASGGADGHHHVETGVLGSSDGGHKDSTTTVLTTPDAGKGGKCTTTVTCASAGAQCGPINNGCGGVIQCGSCATGQTCGGAGKASQCGSPCVAKTCAELGFNCGPAGDGCGKQLACGSCADAGMDGATCGGGGTASTCGSTVTCVSKTCADLGYTCGPAGDGCGNQLDCGTCSGGDTCGGGGTASVCGTPPCTVLTCADIGAATCGPAGDGCGGLLQCGSCSEPQTCGGLTPGQCGIPTSCTNLCLDQVSCVAPGATTSVSGFVYAPNGVDPLPNVLVYIPNAPVDPFVPGVACEQCSAGVSGSPLVTGVTDTTGAFSLTNVPVGTNVPMVIQTGRWRRQVQIPTVTACVNTAIPVCTAATATAGTCLTNLPQTHSQGDIPLMAFATGAVDALECVMRKIGVADSEFTNPGGGGRINLYAGFSSGTQATSHGVTTTSYEALGGAQINASTPNASALLSSLTTMSQYDMLLFPCEGEQIQTSHDLFNLQPPNSYAKPAVIGTWANLQATYQANYIAYANAGGRIFNTHYSYIWLFNDAPFSTTALWKVGQADPADQTGYIQTNFPKGLELAEWLQNIGASTTQGQIAINTLRWDITASTATTPGIPNPPSQLWMQIQDAKDGNVPMHYTFNTPTTATPANQCGKVLFDDFHVENVTVNDANGNKGDDDGFNFPTECATGVMTAQEKLLEFMIFDLGSCVAPEVPTCTPTTCAALGYDCGPAGDGCGNEIQCGTCPSGETCGGIGMPSVCVTPTCAGKSCTAQGINCGPAGDGCGNALSCGSCVTGQACGGGGKAGVCGSGSCVAETCMSQGINCGPAGDGCGNSLTCGSCIGGQTCGGGGKPGVCGTTCTAQTCAGLGYNCGAAADGCGGELTCGTCAAPNTCGGGGQANICGGNIPK